MDDINVTIETENKGLRIQLTNLQIKYSSTPTSSTWTKSQPSSTEKINSKRTFSSVSNHEDYESETLARLLKQHQSQLQSTVTT